MNKPAKSPSKTSKATKVGYSAMIYGGNRAETRAKLKAAAAKPKASADDQAQILQAAIINVAADAVDADNRGDLIPVRGLSADQLRDLI